MTSAKPNQWTAIILAAGQGKRMNSPLPKVLHPVAGIPLVARMVQSCRAAGAGEIRMVVGFAQNLVRQVIEPLGVLFFEQAKMLGTADAVKSAKPDDLEGLVVLLNGDHPLVSATDIKDLLQDFKNSSFDIAVVSTELENPAEFGRIIRQGTKLQAIVEAKDASADTLKIKEISTGIYICQAKALNELLPLVEANNAQKEFYITDIIQLGNAHGKNTGVLKAKTHVAFGVNTQAQLADANKFAYKNKAVELMNQGVTILDPDSVYIEEAVQIGQGSVIYPGAFIKGQTKIGSFTVLEPNVFILESLIGNSCQIRAGSYLEKAQVGDQSLIGPYARLRPETVLAGENQIGNFVELKKVHFGKNSKAAHLSYLGDALVGENVNIGCGTITCNYATDHKKYRTEIGSNVFVGSDTQFVAPVKIGDGAVIGSGSTITKDVPAGALAVARGKQVIKENYQPKVDSKKENKS